MASASASVSDGQPSVDMHPKLPRYARCRNCGKFEDLVRLALLSDDRVNAVPALNLLPDEHRSWFICLKEPSCFRCVKEMYQSTGLAAPPERGGDTPLHHAARCGNLRTLYHLMVLLVREGVVDQVRAVVRAVEMFNGNGETALHTAVSVGNIEIVEQLLSVHPQLAQITCFNSNISPMFLAVLYGRRDIAEALHAASSSNAASSSRSPTPIPICYSGPNGLNALHAAALEGHHDMTEMILSWRQTWSKDLAKEKDEKGRTPLHFAVTVPERRLSTRCYCIPQEIAHSVRQLVDADSSMAYQKDNEGLYPIHVAAQTDQWLSIEIILERCPGCMDLRDNQGRTFLHVAVQNNAVRVVRYACRRQQFAPMLNIQDKNGNTALHLAVDVQNLRVLCILLKNLAVLLNLRNMHMQAETALDVAKRSIRQGFFFAGNPDKLIYRTLQRVGAQHGYILWRRPASVLADREERTRAENLEKEESAKLADSTRTLGLGSVLITSVTFGAAFARVPGGSGAGSGSNKSGSWHFDAFMVANALAFIFAASATIGLMYSGMAMITLPFCRQHFKKSLMLASYSVTCLTAAFALGVYIELAPVSRAAAITISAFCPLVFIYRSAQSLYNHVLVSGALGARLELLPRLRAIVRFTLLEMLLDFWPLAIIFAWAAYSRSNQHG